MWHPATLAPYDVPLIADLGDGYVEGRAADIAGRRVLVSGLGEVCDWRAVLRWTELSPAAGRCSDDGTIICRVH